MVARAVPVTGDPRRTVEGRIRRGRLLAERTVRSACERSRLVDEIGTWAVLTRALLEHDLGGEVAAAFDALGPPPPGGGPVDGDDEATARRWVAMACGWLGDLLGRLDEGGRRCHRPGRPWVAVAGEPGQALDVLARSVSEVVGTDPVTLVGGAPAVPASVRVGIVLADGTVAAALAGWLAAHLGPDRVVATGPAAGDLVGWVREIIPGDGTPPGPGTSERLAEVVARTLAARRRSVPAPPDRQVAVG